VVDEKGDWTVYCLDLNAIVFLGMITIWYVLALCFLLDKRLYEKSKRMHYIALAFLLLWCLFALIVGKFAERLYAILTICGMATVEILVRRRRRFGRHDSQLE
jgi:hypothetical protein